MTFHHVLYVVSLRVYFIIFKYSVHSINSCHATHFMSEWTKLMVVFDDYVGEHVITCCRNTAILSGIIRNSRVRSKEQCCSKKLTRDFA